MSKTFAIERLRLGVDTWANETTAPNAGAGTAAAIGSLWQRNGVATELYLKKNSTDLGWTKQNLVNLNVYNVQNFGAVGDGVTDDRAAIAALIITVNGASISVS